MKNRFIFSFILSLFFVFSGCIKQKENYYKIAALSEDKKAFHVVVEIPAGTNHKIEYNADSGEFENDMKDGKVRVIDFLPYPGNYGFIPSTYMDPERGGDGDPLDVIVIGEGLPTGTVLEAVPVGTLLLEDGGELDTKLVAVPKDENLRVIKATDFRTFAVQYDGVREIIEDWFLSYKGLGVMEFLGWEDENYAWEEIRKWIVE